MSSEGYPTKHIQSVVAHQLCQAQTVRQFFYQPLGVALLYVVDSAVHGP